MWPFGKKKEKEEESDEPKVEEAELDAEGNLVVPVAAPPEEKSAGGGGGGGADAKAVAMLTADVEKLKAQFTTFFEMQKTANERFSMINQQIGELRTMMIERDKSGQHIEAKATQAIDLVKTVQPDKLMIEIRKSDGKVEALRANLESYENILNNMVSELKEVKNKINIFRGMEQVINLNEEAKKHLMEIKKIQAVIERHSDKVETIFTEMQKKSSDFVKTSDTVKDLDKTFKQISSDFDSIKIRMADYSHKKEVENLIAKFDDFEKYASNIIKLINGRFEKLEKSLNDEFVKKFADTDKLLQGFQQLAAKTPDLDKYFNLLDEEAKKVPKKEAPVEKIKEAGEETPMPKVEEKPSLMSKVKSLGDKFKKK